MTAELTLSPDLFRCCGMRSSRTSLITLRGSIAGLLRAVRPDNVEDRSRLCFHPAGRGLRRRAARRFVSSTARSSVPTTSSPFLRADNHAAWVLDVRCVLGLLAVKGDRGASAARNDASAQRSEATAGGERQMGAISSDKIVLTVFTPGIGTLGARESAPWRGLRSFTFSRLSTFHLGRYGRCAAAGDRRLLVPGQPREIATLFHPPWLRAGRENAHSHFGNSKHDAAPAGTRGECARAREIPRDDRMCFSPADDRRGTSTSWGARRREDDLPAEPHRGGHYRRSWDAGY